MQSVSLSAFGADGRVMAAPPAASVAARPEQRADDDRPAAAEDDLRDATALSSHF
jgi:hypothetical protein